jgi:hypothetical protein
MHNGIKRWFVGAWLFLFSSALLISCAANSLESSTQTPALPSPTAAASATLTPTLLPTFTALPTSTPTPTATATITPTPGALPVFQTKLQAGVAPVSYIADACRTLASRWNAKNSAPGTIVVPLMFHSIARPDRAISDDSTISEEYFYRFIEHAHQLGFETITTAQLVDFLQNNAKIPPRSMMLIVDDRKRAEYFTTYFVPYIKKYNWTVTNAWIANPETPAYLWKENEQFAPSGWVDFQAHGVVHNVPIDDSVTQEYVQQEIYGPIQPMTEHFGKRPIGFIWPRGLFTPYAVQVARQAGYQVGFTTLPRGPLLYNWIPQGKDEAKAADPLMVLPRYWDTTAIAALDEAVGISQAAQAFYNARLQPDLVYYQQYCAGYPELPKP